MTPRGAGALAGADRERAARREAFCRARPDAVIEPRRGGEWAGSVVVCRKRVTVAAPSLGLLLDRLGRLAAADAEAMATEAEFPGWRLWLSSVNRWWATRQGPGARWDGRRGVPLTLDADDLPGMRAVLAEARDAQQSHAGGGGW